MLGCLQLLCMQCVYIIRFENYVFLYKVLKAICLV